RGPRVSWLSRPPKRHLCLSTSVVFRSWFGLARSLATVAAERYPLALVTGVQIEGLGRRRGIRPRPCGCEDLPCPVAILAHLHLQRFRVVEFAVGPHKADELHLQLAPVEFAREIEQKYLEHRHAVVERRPCAEI